MNYQHLPLLPRRSLEILADAIIIVLPNLRPPIPRFLRIQILPPILLLLRRHNLNLSLLPRLGQMVLHPRPPTKT